MYEQIRYDRTGRVAIITLHRPETLNATTGVMNRELIDAFRRAGEDRGVGCVVITGAGRAFCAGADVREFRAGLAGGPGYDAHMGSGGRLDTLWNLPAPTLAAINGPAVGVGATLPLACDLAVASDQARIGFTFRRMGLAPEFGASYLLPRIVGLRRTLELCLSGRMIDAEEALRLGLVTSVFPHAAFMDEVLRLAAAIADGPAAAQRMTKESVHRALTATLDATEAWESGYVGPLLRAGPEHREAVDAFLEKRPPVFHPTGGSRPPVNAREAPRNDEHG